MKAYILIQAEPGTDSVLARRVAKLDGVRRVEQVVGPYDLIAEAEWDAAVPDAPVRRIQDLPGVLRALTSLVPSGADSVVTLGDAEMAATGT